jgi:hypothetical protein
MANFTQQHGDKKSPYKQSDCHPDMLHPVVTRNVGDEVNSPSKWVNVTWFWLHSGQSYPEAESMSPYTICLFQLLNNLFKAYLSLVLALDLKLGIDVVSETHNTLD